MRRIVLMLLVVLTAGFAAGAGEGPEPKPWRGVAAAGEAAPAVAPLVQAQARPQRLDGHLQVAQPQRAEAGAVAGEANAAEGEAAEAAAGPNAGDAPRAAALGFEIRPERIYWRSYLYFDESGNIRRRDSDFRLSLNVAFDEPAQPVAYTAPRLTKLVIDDGREVAVEGLERDNNRDRISRNERDNGQFDAQVSMSDVPVGAQRIAVVAGYIPVECGGKQTRQALIAPLAKAENQALRIKGLNKPLTLTMRRNRQGDRDYFRVGGRRTAINRIKRITFYDRHGDELEMDESGRGTSGDNMYLRFRGRLDDQSQVVVTFFKTLREIRVPFELTDVPLTDQARAGGEGLAIRAIRPDQLEVGPLAQGEPAQPGTQPGGSAETNRAGETGATQPSGIEGDRLEVEIEQQDAGAGAGAEVEGAAQGGA